MHGEAYPEVSDDFGHWLAGFIDGEGCFAIQSMHISRPTAGHYTCRFSLRVRRDERPIIEEIARRTGLGVVTESKGHGRSNPLVAWQIQSKADAVALVRLLERYPLRAKKLRDFAIWREAVLDWASQHRVGLGYAKGSAKFDWAHIAALKEKLHAVKRYGATV